MNNMNRARALEVLRLGSAATEADIIAAYNRLARRYPMQQFPERHSDLLQAKTCLLQPELAFNHILHEETLELSWLNQYLKMPQTEAAEGPVINELQQGVQALLRGQFVQIQTVL